MTTKPAKKKPEYEVSVHHEDYNWYDNRITARVKKHGIRDHLLDFRFQISDTPSCCGISLVHGFDVDWGYPPSGGDHPPEKVFVAIGKWLNRRLGSQPHTAFTNNEQQDEEQILAAAGFEFVDEFRGSPGHRSRIKQWKYIPPSRRIRVKKKPSSAKPRSPSTRAKPATR